MDGDGVKIGSQGTRLHEATNGSGGRWGGSCLDAIEAYGMAYCDWFGSSIALMNASTGYAEWPRPEGAWGGARVTWPRRGDARILQRAS